LVMYFALILLFSVALSINVPNLLGIWFNNTFDAFLSAVFGLIILFLAFWYTLLSCLRILYALKNGNFNCKENIKKRQKDFWAVVCYPFAYYFFCVAPLFLWPFIIHIFGGHLALRLFGVVIALFYQILVCVLPWFIVKGFLLLQVFVLEDNLKPKDVIGRSFDIAEEDCFWFIVQLLAISIFILFICLLCFGEKNAYIALTVFQFVIFILIPINLVAGYYTYKKFVKNVNGGF